MKKRLSPEHREKISKSLKGRKASLSTRIKMSDKKHEYHARRIREDEIIRRIRP